MAKVNPFRFSTKYQDDETDLIYYGYRHYSPRLGRWLSRDPLGEASGVNLNGHSNNALTSYVDALGAEFLDLGYRTVFSLLSYGDTSLDLDISAECVPQPSHILFFHCTRYELRLTRFVVTASSRVALYWPYRAAVGYPRYSDELIGAVINHEAKHRRLAEVWHGHNYTKALFAFGGHYSSGGCERKKKALIGKFKRAWNQFRQAQANHGGDEWRGYVLFTPIFASDEDWWSGPDPVSLIQPLEDPLGRW